MWGLSRHRGTQPHISAIVTTDTLLAGAGRNIIENRSQTHQIHCRFLYCLALRQCNAKHTNFTTLILSCHILKYEDWRAKIGIWISWIPVNCWVEHCVLSASTLVGDRVKSVARWAGRCRLAASATRLCSVLPTLLPGQRSWLNSLNLGLGTWWQYI